MGFGDYVLGCAGLAAIAVSLAIAAVQLRRVLVPDWSGSLARLAEATLAVALLIVIEEILGTIGLLTGPAIVACCIVVGGYGWVRGRGASADGESKRPAGAPVPRGQSKPAVEAPRPRHQPAIPPRLNLAVGIAVTVAMFVQWAMPSLQSLDRGIYGGDSLWYHMPFAATFAQSGSITALHFVDPLYLNWFYPQNSELLHAAGIVLFGNDFLSPLINLGWLGLALLAGWCAGRRAGAEAISLTGVAILLAADLMFSRQPGNANNDIVGLALFLAAAAFLLADRRDRGALALAGLAAGLALGTKLTFVVPVAALAIGVVAIAGRGTRLSTAGRFGIPLLIGGGYWYARNIVVAANPLPWQRLGIGPVALPRSEPLHGRDPFSIAHYLTDTSVWRHYFFPGLHERFGELWPLLLVVGAAAIALALWRGGTTLRMLAAVAAVTTVAYVFTPLSASGPPGAPLGFRLNLRYLAPAFGLAFVLLAAPAVRLRGRERVSALAILGLLLAVLLVGQSPLAALDDGYLPGALLIAAGAAAAVAIAVLAARGAPRAALAGGGALVVLVLAGFGWPAQRDYTAQRYSPTAPGYPTTEHPGPELSEGLGTAYQWARGVHDQKIGIGGTTVALFQYGLYGPDSSNRVGYIGARGPRGALYELTTCPAWRRAVNAGGYRFVVTSPGYDQDNPVHPLADPFTLWTALDPSARLIVHRGRVSVFEITAPLNPAGCA